jgi:hypothetical protein
MPRELIGARRDCRGRNRGKTYEDEEVLAHTGVVVVGVLEAYALQREVKLAGLPLRSEAGLPAIAIR